MRYLDSNICHGVTFDTHPFRVTFDTHPFIHQSLICYRSVSSGEWSTVSAFSVSNDEFIKSIVSKSKRINSKLARERATDRDRQTHREKISK